MIRHYNYTNRVKISNKAASIRTFTNEDGIQQFDGELDLSGYSFPVGTKIYLEAYYRTAIMRFPLGDFNPETPSYILNGKLTDLQDPQVNFRIKIVDERNSAGRLIGLAERIPVFNADASQVDRIGLLPVKFQDLGAEIWRIDLLDDGTDPALCINSSLQTGDVPVGEMVRNNPVFLTLVFPQVIRRILEFLLFETEGDLKEDDPDTWENRWIQFTVKLVGERPPEDNEEEQHDWIERSVRAFCEHNKIKERFEQFVMEFQS